MMFMGISSGLGDYDVLKSNQCGDGDCYDTDFQSCIPCDSSAWSSDPSSSSSSSSSSNDTPWWATLTKSVTAGAITAGADLIKGQTPKPTVPKPQPKPWYMTPLGIAGIVIAIGGGAYFIAKK